MTTPTPAQIEAAAIATYRAHCIRHNHVFDWEQSVKQMWMDYAIAALTAAAEVGEQVVCPHCEIIERCAQVAASQEGMAGIKIAAAIRAKKDKP